MKVGILFMLCLLPLQARAATSCLAFMKDSQGGSAGNLPRQIIPGPEKVLWSVDGISITVTPDTKELPQIAVSIVNDGREQLMVGATVWMSGEFLSKSGEAYWILVDCEPAQKSRE